MKGQITIQLTWAFAILAGIAVLALLLSGIGSEEEDSRTVASMSRLSYLETQLKSAALTQESLNKISIPNADFKIICDEYQTSGILMGEAFTPTRFQAIYSQEEMSGSEFLTWSKDWDVYFGSDRVVYLTTPQTLFVAVGSREQFEEFSEKVPEEINLVRVSGDSPTYGREGYQNYRFVFLNGGNPVEEGMDRSYLGLTRPATAVAYYGDEARFYELGELEWEETGRSRFFGDALKYAAMFSTPQNFQCNMEKIQVKARLQSLISMERAKNLMEYLKAERGEIDECYKIMYGNEEENEEKNYNEGLLPGLYEGFYLSPTIEFLSGGALHRIQRIREDLAKGRGCPTL